MAPDSNTVDEVDTPIDLSTVDESAILFYLAGVVPVAVDDLAIECTNSTSEVQSLLHRRFQNQIHIDRTGFVTLTDASRPAVLSRVKPLLERANSAQQRADELTEEGEYDAAIESYRTTEQLLNAANNRLGTTGDVPKKLTDYIESIRKEHDKVLREDIKDTLNHQTLLANQRVSNGDDVVEDGDKMDAMDSYNRAIEALETAKSAAEAHNEKRLHESTTTLDTSPLDRRIEAVELKLKDAREACSGDEENPESSSVETVDSSLTDNDVTATSTEKARTNTRKTCVSTTNRQATSPTQSDVLEAIDHYRDEIVASPKLATLLDHTGWAHDEVISNFDSWNDALEQAGIDKKDALLEDLRRTAKQVTGSPSTGEQNEHGNVSSAMFYDIFDSWDEVLAAADVAEGEPPKRVQTTDQEDTKTENTPQPSEYAGLDDLPPNKRYSDQIAVKLVESKYAGSKRDASLKVLDANGETVRFDFWSKHNLDSPQLANRWYIFEEVRLQQWDSGGSQSRKLSSTRDTTWELLSKEPDAISEGVSHSAESTETTEEPREQSSIGAFSSEATTSTSETEGEVNGSFLDEIESEFEGLD